MRAALLIALLKGAASLTWQSTPSSGSKAPQCGVSAKLYRNGFFVLETVETTSTESDTVAIYPTSSVASVPPTLSGSYTELSSCAGATSGTCLTGGNDCDNDVYVYPSIFQKPPPGYSLCTNARGDVCKCLGAYSTGTCIVSSDCTTLEWGTTGYGRGSTSGTFWCSTPTGAQGTNFMPSDSYNMCPYPYTDPESEKCCGTVNCLPIRFTKNPSFDWWPQGSTTTTVELQIYRIPRGVVSTTPVTVHAAGMTLGTEPCVSLPCTVRDTVTVRASFATAAARADPFISSAFVALANSYGDSVVYNTRVIIPKSTLLEGDNSFTVTLPSTPGTYYWAFGVVTSNNRYASFRSASSFTVVATSRTPTTSPTATVTPSASSSASETSSNTPTPSPTTTPTSTSTETAPSTQTATSTLALAAGSTVSNTPPAATHTPSATLSFGASPSSTPSSAANLGNAAGIATVEATLSPGAIAGISLGAIALVVSGLGAVALAVARRRAAISRPLSTVTKNPAAECPAHFTAAPPLQVPPPSLPGGWEQQPTAPPPQAPPPSLPEGWKQHGPDPEGDIWFSDAAGNTHWALPTT